MGAISDGSELGRIAEQLAEQLERFATRKRLDDPASPLVSRATHLAQRLHFVAAGASLAPSSDWPRLASRLSEIRVEARSLLSEQPTSPR